jgi:pimeloyl-ACP methyl ester carboxylesterase
MQAVNTNETVQSPAIGLLLYASYPATDVSSSLRIPVESISGSRDGLATPAKIKESKALLPSDAGFTVIEGGSHAQFGDYGPQPGDNKPTVSNDEARRQISDASVKFVDSLSD